MSKFWMRANYSVNHLCPYSLKMILLCPWIRLNSTLWWLHWELTMELNGVQTEMAIKTEQTKGDTHTPRQPFLINSQRNRKKGKSLFIPLHPHLTWATIFPLTANLGFTRVTKYSECNFIHSNPHVPTIVTSFCQPSWSPSPPTSASQTTMGHSGESVDKLSKHAFQVDIHSWTSGMNCSISWYSNITRIQTYSKSDKMVTVVGYRKTYFLLGCLNI